MKCRFTFQIADPHQNVANAQKEIDRLEAEAGAADAKTGASDAARKPATESQAVNGSASAGAQSEQTNGADTDVADDLKKTTIEDETTA